MWYYVEGKQRKGPVTKGQIEELIKNYSLNESDYIWRKGFDDWKHIIETEEFKELFPSSSSKQAIDFATIPMEKRCFYVLIGPDRGGGENQYGPYSLKTLKQLFDENRINDQTFLWTNGMKDWIIIAEFPLYEEVFQRKTPTPDSIDQRLTPRKPFVAKMFIHNEKELFEGICRDVSVGGMQVLVENYPAKMNDIISLNVHPDNSEHCFVAKGKVVRLLDGGQGFSLRFTELGEEAHKAINNYIDE